MALPSIFNAEVTTKQLDRLNTLTPESKALWGKMNTAQMLAHLNVGYDATYGKIDAKSSAFKKIMLKLFVKKMVVGEKPYPKNSRTAPYFIVSDEREFESEKAKLAANIQQAETDGEAFFEGKESSAFGKMTAQEWSNQFYKHLDHHFSQFGA
jgi:hypothetical protein